LIPKAPILMTLAIKWIGHLRRLKVVGTGISIQQINLYDKVFKSKWMYLIIVFRSYFPTKLNPISGKNKQKTLGCQYLNKIFW